MTVESSMPHKTSTSCVVKNAGGKAAGGKAAIMIQTFIVSFFYRYLYHDLYSDVYRTFFLSLSLSRSFIAFLNSSWSARSLSERLVLLAIFAEYFCASRFARDKPCCSYCIFV